jgi:putative tryptophan/tyrosine transport system substrate-binding protein
MRRRQFITLLGGAAAAVPLAAHAQQGEKMRRIGVLLSTHEGDPARRAQLTAFVQGLTELGWAEGRNVHLEVRWTAGSVDAARKYAAELEHVPRQLNQEDSHGAQDGRIYRH